MIPQGWQPIGEPPVPELSADAKRVQAYILEHGLDRISHKTVSIMCKCLKIGAERVIDAIYEIRKQEAIIMAKFSPQQRAAIYQSWKDGQKQNELAKQYGVTKSAIWQIIEKLKKEDSASEKPHPGVINKEFDAAVDEMIAENQSADAEKPSAVAEPEPVIETPELPDYVLYAVDCRISELENRLQEFADRKAMLELDLRRLQENIDAVQDEHDKLAGWKLEVDP